MLTDKDQETRNALSNLDVRFWEEEVLLLRAPDRPGLLATVLGELADGGVNLKDAYASVPSGGNVLIVLSVSDIERALSIFSAVKSVGR